MAIKNIFNREKKSQLNPTRKKLGKCMKHAQKFTKNTSKMNNNNFYGKKEIKKLCGQ